MYEFRHIKLFDINKDISSMYQSWLVLDSIVHIIRTSEYPEDIVDDIIDVLEDYDIDCSKKKGGE